MGALEKFLGSPKEIEVDGSKLTIFPLKIKDMPKFSKQNPSAEESKQISKDIIKLSIPDTTDDEIDNLPMETFVKIMDEINKLNGFKDESKERLSRLLEQRKNQ